MLEGWDEAPEEAAEAKVNEALEVDVLDVPTVDALPLWTMATLFEPAPRSEGATSISCVSVDACVLAKCGCGGGNEQRN